MSQSSQLLFGIVLVVVSIGIFITFLPRKGKTLSIVRKPLIAPTLTVLLIGGLAVGLIEIAAFFTAVDELTLSGKVQ